jgi:hypothetical protein
MYCSRLDTPQFTVGRVHFQVSSLICFQFQFLYNKNKDLAEYGVRIFLEKKRMESRHCNSREYKPEATKRDDERAGKRQDKNGIHPTKL